MAIYTGVRYSVSFFMSSSYSRTMQTKHNYVIRHAVAEAQVRSSNLRSLSQSFALHASIRPIRVAVFVVDVFYVLLYPTRLAVCFFFSSSTKRDGKIYRQVFVE